MAEDDASQRTDHAAGVGALQQTDHAVVVVYQKGLLELDHGCLDTVIRYTCFIKDVKY